jgi:peptidoglycan/LPS O-acetylase OafA/YrhL
MSETKDSQPNHKSRAGTLRRAVFWGAISVAMYVAVFLNQDAVTRYFTKEGAVAIAVVVTALAFSLIHGSFANYVIDLSGIRPWQGGNQQKGDH